MENKDNFFKFVENLCSFNEFVEKLSKETSAKIKGDYFEYFAECFFNYYPQCRAEFKKFYLLADVPATLSKKLTLARKDKGIDAVAITKDNKYISVQVKYRFNDETPVNYSQLTSFLATTYTIGSNFTDAIFFSNTRDADKTIEDCDKVRCFLYDMLSDIDENFFKSIKASDKQEEVKLEPRDYQEGIIKSAKNYFKKKENTRGIVYMPCGTGKTATGYWILEALKAKKVIIAVPSLYLLSQIYHMYVKMNSNIKYLLIGSDFDTEGDKERMLDISYTTNPDVVEKFLKDNKNFVIITTYQSSNILHDISNKLEVKYDLAIFDEAHKTCGEFNRNYCVLLQNTIDIKNRLFMTATERVFKNIDEDKKEEIISMDNNAIYGNIICSYGLSDAIEAGYLTDYKIIAPLINEESYKTMTKQNKYINVKTNKLQMRFLMTAYLIIKAFEEHDKITHMLSFSTYNNDALELSKILESTKQKIDVFVLSGKDSMRKRHRVIKEFNKSPRAIICSAKIFTEGINIPIVNSVCFTDNKGSTIDIIQCCGRPLRLYPNKKEAYILLPTIIDDIRKDNILDISKDFTKIKAVLRAMGNIDTRLAEEFIVRDNKKIRENTGKFIIESNNIIEVGKNIDLLEFKKSIITYICDKNGKFSWNVKYKKVKEFYDNPDNDKRDLTAIDRESDEYQLVKWCDKQRERKNILTKEQIDLLENLKDWWYWDSYGHWEVKFKRVKKFIEENEKFPTKNDKGSKEDMLANWCSKQKSNKDSLTEEQREKLESLKGKETLKWYWNSDEKWENKYNELVSFINKSKTDKIPSKGSKDPIEKEFGLWCFTQRKNRDKLDEFKTKKLKEIKKWFWGLDLKGAWENKYNELIKFLQENKNNYPKTNSTDSDEKSLAYWVKRMRGLNNGTVPKGKLTDEQREKLGAINFKW